MVDGLKSEIPFVDEEASLSEDISALDRSLLLIVTEYQNKRTQFEGSRITDLSGIFFLLLCHSCASVSVQAYYVNLLLESRTDA